MGTLSPRTTAQVPRGPTGVGWIPARGELCYLPAVSDRPSESSTPPATDPPTEAAREGAPPVPTRRIFLGTAAAAALAPACFAPPPGATRQPSAADVPVARKAGAPAPDIEALLAQMTLDEKIGQ